MRYTILLEWLIGLVILAILLVMYKSAYYFNIIVAVTVTLLVIGAYPYWQLWRKITTIPTQSLKESLIAYLAVVRIFIKRIEWFCILGMPIGAALGMYLSLQEQTIVITPTIWALLVGTSLLIGILFYMPIKYWYIPLVYGKTEQQLERLLEQLTTEN